MIRQRRAEDLDECVAILAQVHRADRYPTYWPADPRRWLTPANMMQAWVATTGDGRIIGHAMVRREQGTGMASLSRLFVAPQGRGHGAGKALLAQVTQWAQEEQVVLTLEVVAKEGHAAIALYEGNGWRRTHASRASWARDGEEIIAYHYELVEVETQAPPPAGAGEQQGAPVS